MPPQVYLGSAQDEAVTQGGVWRQTWHLAGNEVSTQPEQRGVSKPENNDHSSRMDMQAGGYPRRQRTANVFLPNEEPGGDEDPGTPINE